MQGIEEVDPNSGFQSKVRFLLDRQNITQDAVAKMLRQGQVNSIVGVSSILGESLHDRSCVPCDDHEKIFTQYIQNSKLCSKSHGQGESECNTYLLVLAAANVQDERFITSGQIGLLSCVSPTSYSPSHEQASMKTVTPSILLCTHAHTSAPYFVDSTP